eukprot:6190315-Pleurochrysis_carterae.AAC.1
MQLNSSGWARDAQSCRLTHHARAHSKGGKATVAASSMNTFEVIHQHREEGDIDTEALLEELKKKGVNWVGSTGSEVASCCTCIIWCKCKQLHQQIVSHLDLTLNSL